MTPKEASETLNILRQGSPEQMNAFANKLKRLNILRRTRNPRRAAAAAIGAGAGLLLGDDQPEE
jgi:hypothetical protein